MSRGHPLLDALIKGENVGITLGFNPDDNIKMLRDSLENLSALLLL